METFYTTIAIVFGILFPVIVVCAIAAVIIIGKSLPIMIETKLEQIKKQAPFDEVEVSRDFERNTVIARFYKDGQLVWQGDVQEALKNG